MNNNNDIAQLRCQDATYELLSRLGNSCPFCIAPTVLFDNRGIMNYWVRSIPPTKKQKLGWYRIKYSSSDMINLLCLYADWEERAKDLEMKDSVCIQATSDRFVCVDLVGFKNLVKKLGKQEAFIRSDTYDLGDKEFIKGPFFLQAFIPARDDELFKTTFHVASDQKEGGEDELIFDFQYLEYSKTYSHPAKVAATTGMYSVSNSDNTEPISPKSNIATNNNSSTNNQDKDTKKKDKQKEKPNDAEKLLYSEMEELLSSNVVLPGMQAKLRDAVMDIVQYFEREQVVSIKSLTVYHIICERTNKLVFLYASNLVWAKPKIIPTKKTELLSKKKKQKKITTDSKNQVDQRVEQQQQQQKSPLGKKNHHQGNKVTMEPIDLSYIQHQQIPFIPSSKTPKELLTPSLLRTKLPNNNNNNNGVKDKNIVPDHKAYHCATVLKGERSIDLVMTSQKLAEALREIEILNNRVNFLETNAIKDRKQLLESDSKIQHIKEKTKKIMSISKSRETDLLARIKHLQGSLDKLANENIQLNERIAVEESKRLKVESLKQKLELNHGQISTKYGELLKRYVAQDGADAEELTGTIRKLQAFVGEKEDEIFILNNKLLEMERIKAENMLLREFKKNLFTILADLETPGVNPPKRLGGGFGIYPVPGPANVRIAVKALVDNLFPQNMMETLIAQTNSRNSIQLTNSRNSIQLGNSAANINNTNNSGRKSFTALRFAKVANKVKQMNKQSKKKKGI